MSDGMKLLLDEVIKAAMLFGMLDRSDPREAVAAQNLQDRANILVFAIAALEARR